MEEGLEQYVGKQGLPLCGGSRPVRPGASWLPLARMPSPAAALLRGQASGTGPGRRMVNKARWLFIF